MSDAVARLAVVLPLLLLLLGGVLFAARRGLIRLPGATLGTPPLRVVQIVALGPGARLAVVDFAGAQLLLGVGRNGVRVLSAPSPPAKRGVGRVGVGAGSTGGVWSPRETPTPALPTLRLRRGGREQQA